MRADIDALIEWFQSNGGTVDLRAIGITEFPGSGRGAVALCDIPTDHTLFSLPRVLTLSTRTSPLPQLFGLDKWRAHNLHKGWVGLILCMMWEDACAHEQGIGIPEAGKWTPYIYSLPETFDTPMFWSEYELEELKGTGVVDKIGRQDAECAYHESLIPAVKAVPSLFPPHHLQKWYTLEAYHCAGSRILSRSFTVSRWTSDDSAEEWSNNENNDTGVCNSESEPEDSVDNADTSLGSAMDVDELPPTSDDEDDPSDVAMVPMADLLNARWGCENAKLFCEPKILRMVATRSIKKGEQIFNTYGDPPNSVLLRRYGHVDLIPLNVDANNDFTRTTEINPYTDGAVSLTTLGNPSDVVEIKADLVVEVVRARWGTKEIGNDIEERIEWWLDEGGDDTFVLPHPNNLRRDTNSPYELPREFISFTRLLLPDADFESARKKGKLPKSKQPDAEVLGVLEEVLKNREAMYAGGTVEVRMDYPRSSFLWIDHVFPY
ncbi:hypothetical protein SCLCIDRAFT_102571 [Scleroderma citrinum Foug A]|uniref:SET domain-containing protein n=1 Tax=Scleroderma citrinum Foug A TaxID=1036808 RepID=A0A0C3EMV1_9AGAM|nr:hypothetical protein SCLCIDRAFT_102571 [Scleroderma citrinum Foug A]